MLPLLQRLSVHAIVRAVPSLSFKERRLTRVVPHAVRAHARSDPRAPLDRPLSSHPLRTLPIKLAVVVLVVIVVAVLLHGEPSPAGAARALRVERREAVGPVGLQLGPADVVAARVEVRESPLGEAEADVEGGGEEGDTLRERARGTSQGSVGAA